MAWGRCSSLALAFTPTACSRLPSHTTMPPSLPAHCRQLSAPVRTPSHDAKSLSSDHPTSLCSISLLSPCWHYPILSSLCSHHYSEPLVPRLPLTSIYAVSLSSSLPTSQQPWVQVTLPPFPGASLLWFLRHTLALDALFCHLCGLLLSDPSMRLACPRLDPGSALFSGGLMVPRFPLCAVCSCFTPPACVFSLSFRLAYLSNSDVSLVSHAKHIRKRTLGSPPTLNLVLCWSSTVNGTKIHPVTLLKNLRSYL